MVLSDGGTGLELQLNQLHLEKAAHGLQATPPGNHTPDFHENVALYSVFIAARRRDFPTG